MKFPKPSLFVRKSDFVIIGIIAAVAIIGLIFLKLNSQKGAYAEISVNGSIIADIKLEGAADKSFCLDEIENVEFQIKNGEICIKENDCADKICINTGFIGNTNESIICLPKKLSVVVKSADENDTGFDASVG